MASQLFAFAPSTLEEEVIYSLSWMGGFQVPPEQIKPEMSLKVDLLLTITQLGALRRTFLFTARQRNPNARIERRACEQLKTVQEAIDLVTKASKS